MRRRPYVPILNPDDVFLAGHIHALQIEIEKEKYSPKVTQQLRNRLQVYRDRLLDSLRGDLNDMGYDPESCELPRVIAIESEQAGTQMLFRWEERQPSLPEQPLLVVAEGHEHVPTYESEIYWQRRRPGVSNAPSRRQIDDRLVVLLINVVEWVKEAAYELRCLTKVVSTDRERWEIFEAAVQRLQERKRNLDAPCEDITTADVFRLLGPLPVETRQRWQDRLADPARSHAVAYRAFIDTVADWHANARQGAKLPRHRLARTIEAADYLARTLHGHVLALARESMRSPGETLVDGFVSWEPSDTSI